MATEKRSFIERFAAFVVDRRRWFLLLFAALFVFSAFSVRWISVEEDITYYLPDDAEAKRGLFIMEEEFTTYGSAQVLVKNVTASQAQALSEQLSELEDVVLVRYDGSAASYKDGCALFDLTFADTADSARSARAMERVRQLLADRETTVYTEVGFSLSELVAEQMRTVLIFVIIVVLAVLVFTSSTYAEIPVMILTFLAAAVVNIGTHFLMGTISFVSNSVGIVLQLALSVDYAIIFCNRYKEEHGRLDVRDAAVRALAVSIPEISASSLTTIAGLTAMTLMQFRLGVDLGLTLIKAIVCSLLTVFLFMPALLMLFGKAMDRTRHRSFVPKISFAGRFAYRSRRVVPLLFVALVAFGCWMSRQVSYAYSLDMVPAFRRTERELALEEIRETFGPTNTVALLVPSGDYGSEAALLEDLSACPEVKSASGLAGVQAVGKLRLGDRLDYRTFAEAAGVDETLAKGLFAYFAAERGEHRNVREDPEGYRAPLLDLFLFLHDRLEAGDVELEASQAQQIETLYERLRLVREQLTGENYSRLILDLNLPVQGEETFRFLDRIHRMAGKYYEQGAVLTGDSVSALGFRDSFASDNTLVGLMSLGLVMLILFFTFRSFGMPLLLILVIQGSIWLNFAVAALQGNYVFFLCYIIVGAIQMGANIDYAIVVSSRYRELRQNEDQRTAIIDTLNLAFPTVITSGLMMICAGLLVGFGVSQCIIAGMGYYVGTGTGISLLLIFFALPQILLAGDAFVASTTLHPERSRILAFLVRNRLRFAGALLGIGCLCALAAGLLVLQNAAEELRGSEQQVQTLREEVGTLRTLADKLQREGEDLNTLKYDFAQQLVTDNVGSEQLAEGEQQLSEGEKQYQSGLEQYEDGAARLEEAEKEYDEGAARLAAAQEEYDAGLAAYREGQRQVESAREELRAGQAAYDAGAAAYEEGQQRLREAQAAYDAGEAGYKAAKAALDAISPLYDAILNLDQEIEALQAQYEAAMAEGDYGKAMLLMGALNMARASLETQLGQLSRAEWIARYQQAQTDLAAAEQLLAEGKQQLDEGYAQAAEAERQLDEGKKQLEAGYARLADAQQQLADAEEQLTEGKAALEAGYAQLDEGGQQIREGREQLDDAKAQLEAGEKELNENRQKLEEGRELLAENLEELNKSLSALDAFSEDTERLRQGLRLLRSQQEIRELLPVKAGAFEVLNASDSYAEGLRETAERDSRTARLEAGALFAVSGLTALTAVSFGVLQHRRQKARTSGSAG